MPNLISFCSRIYLWGTFGLYKTGCACVPIYMQKKIEHYIHNIHFCFIHLHTHETVIFYYNYVFVSILDGIANNTFHKITP